MEKIKVLFPGESEKRFSGDTEVDLADFEKANMEIAPFSEERARKLKESLGEKEYIGLIMTSQVSSRPMNEVISELVGKEHVKKLFVVNGSEVGQLPDFYDEKTDDAIFITPEGEISAENAALAEKFGVESRALFYSGGAGGINDPFYLTFKKTFMEKMLKEGKPQGGVCMAYQNFLDMLVSQSGQKGFQMQDLGEFGISPARITEKGKEHSLTEGFKGNIVEPAFNQYSFVFPSGTPDNMNVLAVRKADGAPSIVTFSESGGEIVTTEHHPEIELAQRGVETIPEDVVLNFPDFDLTLQKGDPKILATLMSVFQSGWEKYQKEFGLTPKHLERLTQPPTLPEGYIGKEFYGRALEILLKNKK